MAIRSIAALRRVPFNLTLATALVSDLSSPSHAIVVLTAHFALSLRCDTPLRASQ